MKLNKGILITSIAMTLVIFGVSITLTIRYGYELGLPCGLGAFLLLIGVMLIVNRRKKKKNANRSMQNKTDEK